MFRLSRCVCGEPLISLAQRRSASFNTGASGQTSSNVLDDVEREQLRRSAETGSRAGPFPMPPRPDTARPLNASERRSWTELGIGEKLGRLGERSASLVVILFGAGLTTLVIFSLSTELFATNSPTRIVARCVDLIKDDRELNSILRAPYILQGEGAGHRNRRVVSAVTTDPQTGAETMTVRFQIVAQGVDPRDQSLGWMETLKRKVTRPLIVEPSSGRVEVIEPEMEPESKGERQSWWRSWLGAILPAAAPALPRLVPPPKPVLGQFNSADATVTLHKRTDTNEFTIDSLLIEIPNSAHQPKPYRIHIRTRA
ncbi:uncharacterized protein L969DRAFT_93475 [Mixia osmundae IAM 14324]|uniref:Mitochondrial import inner membrane translocase subunit Tim21 n=1 Tax=Mixia osmundae (strain CBS 9802 / IAM 14324 / JCM 22182 / KY 12970) TaxID=764103 RepID=G7DU30_MIXOS|nr:uncharacterized protein L969DRAFT_93475 [Mixia osmundae IAM 14324]KEI40957.1 hypothetical protein L969DRAFT_93475 [Mixia osmundae IAM 14324]GAA94090.1 hypothetical protein E5Q_00737 [Mixia osmundae IAM 14324]